ncbi:MAG: pseudouridine synthase [Tenericutes bacterium]|jgi:23S rRNA pseudouridine1911/1915/1917 synthase|nr:pseudouridine synthase [Mycoplasmatota bacterium]
MKLNILFEDNHIIVTVKPPGILSQAGPLDIDDMLTLLKEYIKEKYDKPGNVYLGLIHRLDLNVGGVMVFAKTSKAAKRLNEQMRNHVFSKQYFGIVIGDMSIDQHIQVLENYIRKDKLNKLALITKSSRDQFAKLTYQAIEKATINNQVMTLIDIQLETGRFHQIRAQFSHIGYPLYGDNKYGPKTRGYEIGLYSYQLSFNHPVTQELLTFIHYPTEGIFSYFKLLGNKGDKL